MLGCIPFRTPPGRGAKGLHDDCLSFRGRTNTFQMIPRLLGKIPDSKILHIRWWPSLKTLPAHWERGNLLSQEPAQPLERSCSFRDVVWPAHRHRHVRNVAWGSVEDSHFQLYVGWFSDRSNNFRIQNGSENHPKSSSWPELMIRSVRKWAENGPIRKWSTSFPMAAGLLKIVTWRACHSPSQFLRSLRGHFLLSRGTHPTPLKSWRVQTLSTLGTLQLYTNPV